VNENEIDREKLELRDDPQILSAPTVSRLYACATAVTVSGFVPHAKLELEIDGGALPLEQAGYPDPDGYTFTGIGPLTAGQAVRARQHAGGVASPWSTPVTVRDHTVAFPSGPPRPEVSPEPVYECGARTGVRNLLVGCNVWITADGGEVGRVNGAKEHQGVNVNPDYSLNQRVRAWADMCHDPSPPSLEYLAGPPPNPLPTPAIDDAYDGGERIRITNLVNGARFTVDRGGSSVGPYRTWGHAHLVTLTPALTTGETIAVTQTMCASNPPSDPGKTDVKPCSDLPAPEVHPIQVGATSVTVTNWVAGAQIKVFQGTQKIGDGGPPVVMLTQPIDEGVPVYVYQVVGTCTGSTVRVIEPRCVAPPTGGNPAGLNLFPVGRLDFASGPYKGSVHYPAEDDGDGQDFNKRRAEVTRSPIVFMAHGNHGIYHHPDDRENEDCTQHPGWLEIPNHKGYRYLQTQLARMGCIAVSVDCNATNCTYNTLTNIEERADLIMGTIDHFQNLDSGGDAIFGDKIDFNNVGLLGHSRGGEAVVIAGNQAPGRFGIDVKAVISLAPVNHDVYLPENYAFMTILPASDGDVSDNGGARFYDRGAPAPFKSQIYIDAADHNYFNREWVNDEDDRLPPAILYRGEHERILSRYGCAFFRSFLMGQDLTRYLEYRTHPPGIDTAKVHLSFEWAEQTMVDDHEQPNGIAKNTMDEPTSQSSGVGADEFELWRFAGNAHPTNSFWGRTVGMVMESRRGGIFRSQLDGPHDLSPSEDAIFEIWVRVAEVSNGGSNPAGDTGFEMGLEDGNGLRAWADSDNVGGVPRPFDDSPGATKSMMSTLRFPVSCFNPEEVKFELRDLRAVLIRFHRTEPRPIAFDVLQIVTVKP
jgi:hypothetical protein